MQNKRKQYCRPSGNEKQQQKDGAVAGKQQAVSTTNRKPAAQLAGERQQRRSFAGFSQRLVLGKIMLSLMQKFTETAITRTRVLNKAAAAQETNVASFQLVGPKLKRLIL